VAIWDGTKEGMKRTDTYTKSTHGKKKKVENFVTRRHHMVCNVAGSGKYNCLEYLLLSCYVEITKAKNT